jgi:2,4-dienoyl-CoA reductase-like NADH-dependent reductase (Old Yellow Enzyme family)
MNSTINLFAPTTVGTLALKNRIVMAPMTRARNFDGIPNDNNALYYQQRSGAGLIITEGTAISNTAMGVLHILGFILLNKLKVGKK